jgi:hypothetical protein
MPDKKRPTGQALGRMQVFNRDSNTVSSGSSVIEYMV